MAGQVNGADFIRFERITKRFAGVTALNDVSFSIARGECHALMGENGAGKSTLGKVLAGIHRADDGAIILDGQPITLRSARDALRHGIGMVHQELAFCPELPVAENICLGQYPRRFGLVDRSAMRRRAERALARIGASIDVRSPMRSLSTAQEQLVQIASAVDLDARVLIFDEPTSSLSQPDAERLFTLIENLRSGGVTIIYVSHRMPEVFRLSDAISVLRDGNYVGTPRRAEATPDAVVRMMIGRLVVDYLPEHLAAPRGDVVLSVRNLSSLGRFEKISFDIHAGEIVGLAGLVGAGRSEIAMALFGLDARVTGSVSINGTPLPLRKIRCAMQRELGFLPEDRKRQGLVLPMSGRANLSLAMLDRLGKVGLLRFGVEKRIAREYFDRLRVRAPSIETPVGTLSGGNQQKVALAKWLARGAKLLIVDEPTRGVDIGAKAAIHQLLDELAQRGVAILLISSDLPEVIALSTRIIAMRNGRLVGELPHGEATQEKVLRMMAGVAPSISASVN